MSDLGDLTKIENGLFRARALIAGLRLIAEEEDPDRFQRDAIYILASEAEEAADDAVKAWRTAWTRAGGDDRG